MSITDLREKLREILGAMGAVRNSQSFLLDTLKRGYRSNDVAEFAVKQGYGTNAQEIAVLLGRLAKDASVRPYCNYVGGEHAEPWNNWEWSLPPE